MACFPYLITYVFPDNLLCMGYFWAFPCQWYGKYCLLTGVGWYISATNNMHSPITIAIVGGIFNFHTSKTGETENGQNPNTIGICSCCALNRPVFEWNPVLLHPELTPWWSLLMVPTTRNLTAPSTPHFFLVQTGTVVTWSIVTWYET